MATLFSGWVLLVTWRRGSTQFDRYGLTTWSIIGACYVGGISAGLVVGLLRPLTSSAFGAMVVGSIAGTGVYGAISYAMGGEVGVFGVSLLGTLAGSAVGYWMWRDNRPSSKRRAA